MKRVTAYADGAFWKNEKIASSGVVIKKGHKYFHFSRREGKLGDSSSAEYKAFIFCLKKLITLGMRENQINLHTDYQVLVRQIKGEILPPRDEIHCKMFREILYLLSLFTNCVIQHVKSGINPAHKIAQSAYR